MKRQYMMYLAAFIGLVILSGLFKQKACQDQDSGNLSARPWYWPCPKNSATTASASTD